jgi:hypothetical protein
MATVRISNTLRDNILRNAEILFHTEAHLLNKSMDVQEVARAAVLAEMDRRFDRIKNTDIPIAWAAQKTSFLRLIIKDSRLQGPHYLSLHNIDNLQVTADVYDDNRIESSLLPEHEQFVAHFEKHESISARRINFLNHVKAVLDSCTTLKQFLKAWPEGEKLVPDDAMRRHREHHLARQRRRDQTPIEVPDELTTELTKQTILNTIHNE